MKILLAEDEPDLQLITRMALEDANYTVVVANNGVEALAAVGRDHFDLLLIDVMMPQMDGLELCQRLQYHPTWQHIPIVLFTASPKSEALLHDLPPSVRFCIEKPFSVFELVDMIKSILASEGR
ncbi:response regulator [Chloroflexus sp.]|uniref:response regulator n=1 Tax=Chloroflexus sp. TaxID=1904827 RepID=UPI0026071649|nr:response regulator [uncultured Chloroflexus sp.]